MIPHLAARPGDPVRVVTTKWGERPHWEFDGLFLGVDEHGDWIGFPAGTSHARPGMSFTSEIDSVSLAPAGGAWHVATFWAPGLWCHTYVDISTPATWDTSGQVPVLRAVDLDLDVIRGEHGRVWVDDEDELAEHRVTLGYPDELVRGAERSAEAVLAVVTARTPPYDGATTQPWFDRLTELRSAR